MSVLVVVTRRTGAVRLARLGFRAARALEEKLVVLCLESGGEGVEPTVYVPGAEVPEGTSPTVVEICSALERRGKPQELDEAGGGELDDGKRILPDPEVEVRQLKTRRQPEAVLAQSAEVRATLLVAERPKMRQRAGEAPLSRRLFTAASCRALLVRPGDSGGERLSRILVPTAGGPHARVALRLGERLVSAEDGEMVALYVEPDVAELAREVGERILRQALAAAGVSRSRFVRPRVELAEDYYEAIAEVAAEGFDLLLVGASNVGALRRSLFGTVPDRLLTGEEGMMVAVVRREWKLLHRVRQRLGRWFDLAVPQMSRDDRIALFEKLQSGSEWNFDFMTLIALSTAIASLGLLQSSAAVVIGAMLVAPLMTPILGAGLALVQGNLPLMRTAARALAYGYLLALLIGLGLGLLFPIPELTPELLARGGPTLLDMGVAFLSGIAAAYCLGRPGLLAALPGVAIAAALVPPIATTGASLALGHGAVARGAALLFATNVVAIILGAAATFWAGGVRTKGGETGGRRWARWAFLGLVLGALVLAVPLGSFLISQLSGDREVVAALPAELEIRVEERLAGHPGTELLAVVGLREGRGEVVEVRLTAPAPTSPELAAELAAAVREELGREAAVRVTTWLAVEVP